MPNKHSNLSIILYGLRFSPLSYEEKLRKLRGIGYRSIQGGVQPGDPRGLPHRGDVPSFGSQATGYRRAKVRQLMHGDSR